jgi:hypothetical protein
MCAISKFARGKERPSYGALIRRHCVPIQAAAADPREAGGLKLIGGSALLFETIERRFLVTACHVWRELWKLTRESVRKYVLLVHDITGTLRITHPILIDECEDLDLAVITFDGINDYAPGGKAFLQALRWPTAPAQPGEFVVGCGYPGDARTFRSGQWEQQILFWAFKDFTSSKSGNRLLLHGQSARGEISYFTKRKPGIWKLPGISGAPLFVLRNTIDWVGTVRSGAGNITEDISIQATPSAFVRPDGLIVRPCTRNAPGECDCGKYLAPLRHGVGGRLKNI